MDSINIPHYYKLYIAWIIYFDFNWSNVTPFVWIQLTLEFHISFFSSSQSNGKSKFVGLHIIEFISVLEKSNLVILSQVITNQRCIIILMGCNISLILAYIGELRNLFVVLILNTIFPGELSRSGGIWNKCCVIIYAAIFITLDCEERLEDMMRLRETSLCHHASHKVIYSRERTQLSEPMLYFTYLFFFYACTHSIRTSKC